ncbi:MAG: hypothetical protein ACPG8A_03595 [Psychrobium sp.]
MKKVLVLVALFFAFLTTVNAGEKADFQQRFEKVKERLQLTPQQVDIITPILVESAERTKKVLAKYDINLDETNKDNRAKLGFSQLRKLAKDMATEREKTTQALAKHLTTQQMETFQSLQEERKKEMRSRILNR